MSDFLKTFRSNQKNRSSSRGTPGYDGHYYPTQDRRNGNERRSTNTAQSSPMNSLIEKTEDLFPVIREIIENTTEQNEKILQFQEEQVKFTSEITGILRGISNSLDSIAKSMGGSVQTIAENVSPQKNLNNTSISQLSKEDMYSPADERKDILKTIKKLRAKGGTYKEIAAFLNSKNIPTFSKKGNWHAQTIHRICSQ